MEPGVGRGEDKWLKPFLARVAYGLAGAVLLFVISTLRSSDAQTYNVKAMGEQVQANRVAIGDTDRRLQEMRHETLSREQFIEFSNNILNRMDRIENKVDRLSERRQGAR